MSQVQFVTSVLLISDGEKIVKQVKSSCMKLGPDRIIANRCDLDGMAVYKIIYSPMTMPFAILVLNCSPSLATVSSSSSVRSLPSTGRVRGGNGLAGGSLCSLKTVNSWIVRSKV